MKTVALQAELAPAERATAELLARQVMVFQKASLLQRLSDAIPDLLLILNQQRQIVYANRRLTEVFGLSCWEDAVGKRPGEVFRCLHSQDAPGGCGTTEFCQACGLVGAVLVAQQGTQSVKECRILTRDNRALDLLVWATPYEQDGDRYTICAAADVSSEKRRRVLERVFFHDVLNTAGGVYGLSALLVEEDDLDEAPEIAGMIYRSSESLIDEIKAQRQLTSAERGDLQLAPSELDSLDLLKQVAETLATHKVASGRSVQVGDSCEARSLVSDGVLVKRVLVNMVKNALEATPKGGVVTLSCWAESRSMLFSVHNPSYMPREIQLQVFKRSFSTKGRGRGIGTYSIKLFTEKYLGGSAWFKSSEQAGTTFFVSLPKNLENS